MISLHYISHTKAYNTIYTACNIVEAIYSFTMHNVSTYGTRSINRPYLHLKSFSQRTKAVIVICLPDLLC